MTKQKKAQDNYIKGYMKSKPGEDDYSMFVNEQPHGGFKWEFLDYEPVKLSDYKPIYIYLKPREALQDEEVEALKAKLEKAVEALKDLDSGTLTDGTIVEGRIVEHARETLRDIGEV